MEQKLYFQNSKGVKLCGIVSKSNKIETDFIVIFVHGFASNKNTSNFVKLKNILIRYKIPSFRFDFFGHGESEGKFEEITVSEAVDDILNALKFVEKLGYKRIGLIGSSFGGLTSIIVYSISSHILFLALKSPVVNLFEKEVLTKSKKEIEEWRSKGFRYYLTSDKRKLKINYSFFEDARKYDGYKFATKINIPVLIVHGDKDEIVPVEQSIKLSKIISNSKLILIKGADHRYSFEKHAEEMRKAIVKFIIKNCQKSS